MAARQTWTVDRLHHALPHSASRQQLLADVNLTPIDELSAVLDRWVAAAEALQVAAPRIAAVRPQHTTASSGDTAVDHTADVLRDAGHRADRKPGRGAS
ncbi:hypothetical protein [Streptomyces gardneri]|uniref:Uncharacterized protein n=1 Tax=Streptomyces gardneri TaxID=66892 RepID=A0A4Y3RK05_9ACTN|nr:hypothetical protein [Streptomyces gardneri]GEB57033.1 hypothetical protein SGA01_26380 [Streptomyces gardneri]GHH16836.1 hypothetical protein GCM10017674_67230 [Streptomyces gardneri]